MSREQVRGEKLDFRSDVYALGIVVFELFTGQLPFKGDTAIATIMQQLQDPPPPASGPAAATAVPAAVPVPSASPAAPATVVPLESLTPMPAGTVRLAA